MVEVMFEITRQFERQKDGMGTLYGDTNTVSDKFMNKHHANGSSTSSFMNCEISSTEFSTSNWELNPINLEKNGELKVFRGDTVVGGAGGARTLVSGRGLDAVSLSVAIRGDTRRPEPEKSNGAAGRGESMLSWDCACDDARLANDFRFAFCAPRNVFAEALLMSSALVGTLLISGTVVSSKTITANSSRYRAAWLPGGVAMGGRNGER